MFLDQLFKPIDLEAVLQGPLPAKAVRDMPSPDVYFALQEVGDDTRREVLALVTSPQLQGLLDLDLWEETRLDLHRLRDWYHELLVSVPEGRIYVHLRELDVELLTALVVSEYRVFPVGPDFDADAPSADADWQSPDGKFWLYRRATPLNEDSELAGRMLDLLYRNDPERAYGILLEASVGLPSELEETAYRFREARLADLGFPPEEVAQSIWSPAARTIASPAVDEGEAPRYVAIEVARGVSLQEHLAALPEDRQRAVGEELVVLANAAIMSEGLRVRKNESVREALAMVSGYLELGLTTEEGRRAVGTNMQQVFRIGLGIVAPLSRRARKLLATGVFDRWGRRLTMLSSAEAAFMTSLAQPHARFAEPSATEPRIEAFRSLDQVARAEEALARMEEAATFFFLPQGLANQSKAWEEEDVHPPREERSIHTLAGTMLARLVLRRPLSVEPVTLDDVKKLLASLDRLGDFREGIEKLPAAARPLGQWLARESEKWIADLEAAGGKPQLVTGVLWHDG